MSTVPVVRAFIRSRGRAPASWLDRYTTLFGLAMLGAVLARPVSSALAAIVHQADPSRTGAGVALITLAYAGLLAIARAVGPLAVPAPDAAWLVLSPLDRRGVLGRTARLLLVISVLAGAALGVGVLAVLGAPDQLTIRLVIAVILGLSAGVGGMALTVLSQSSQAWSSWLHVTLVAITLLAAVTALSASGPARRFLTASRPRPRRSARPSRPWPPRRRSCSYGRRGRRWRGSRRGACWTPPPARVTWPAPPSAWIPAP